MKFLKNESNANLFADRHEMFGFLAHCCAGTGHLGGGMPSWECGLLDFPDDVGGRQHVRVKIRGGGYEIGGQPFLRHQSRPAILPSHSRVVVVLPAKAVRTRYVMRIEDKPKAAETTLWRDFNGTV